MKRTSLTTAVIAGIAGVAGISNMASAVYLNSDGLGQVLIYPYYTVNGGNSTAITVVNTTGAGKAVKVRFLEAYDSREVLDFNLYLSPYDLWVSQVVPVGSGAGVYSNDNSCTVPALPKSAGSAVPFRTTAFDGSTDSFGNTLGTDGGPVDVSRTLEGYVELIEMGTVTNTSQNSLAAITHAAGVPKSCAQVVSAWSGGYWTSSATTDIGVPSGGLFGAGTVVNPALGTIEGYNADAIDQFYLAGDLVVHHTAPGSLSPSIASATNITGVTSYVFAPSPSSSTPSLVTTTYINGIDAVSSLFMADAIYNEYWTNGGTAANSEWVVTFPTKRFYVDPSIVSTAQKPFDKLFTSANGGTSCSPIQLLYYGREEEKSGGSVDFSPSLATGTTLCYESQVISFNQGKSKPTKVLGSNLTANINTGYANGWATINLYNSSANHVLPASLTVSSKNVFEGLPVTGFWVAQLVNGSVGGVLANYTSLYRHKSHRTCSTFGQTTGSVCS